MFNRVWADYEDGEELPPLPWYLVIIKPKPETLNPVYNKFWVLLLDCEEEFDEDYCIGRETGAISSSTRVCCK